MLKVWHSPKSSNMTCKLVKMQILRPVPRLTESETWGVGPSEPCFNRSSMWFWYRLKFQNRWSILFFLLPPNWLYFPKNFLRGLRLWEKYFPFNLSSRAQWRCLWKYVCMLPSLHSRARSFYFHKPQLVATRNILQSPCSWQPWPFSSQCWLCPQWLQERDSVSQLGHLNLESSISSNPSIPSVLCYFSMDHCSRCQGFDSFDSSPFLASAVHFHLLNQVLCLSISDILSLLPGSIVSYFSPSYSLHTDYLFNFP